MADNQKYRYKREFDKVTTQAAYARAVNGNGNDVAYKFISRDDIKYLTQKDLEKVGIYYGENDLDIPLEFNNKWINIGYNVGKRKVKEIKYDEIKEDPDYVESERANAVKDYILSRNGKFSQDENDLINVGIYFKNNCLELPKEFDSLFIWFGYYDIPLEIIYDANTNSHSRK